MADTFTPKLNLIKPDVLKDALISDINGNMDLIDSEFTALDARLDVLDTNAPVVSSTVVSGVGADWEIVEQQFYKLGKFIFGNIRIKRLNTAISSPADGNIINATIASVAAGWRPPNEVSCSPTGAYGPPIPGIYINAAGTLAVGALIPGVPWAVNSEVQVSTFYIQAG